MWEGAQSFMPCPGMLMVNKADKIPFLKELQFSRRGRKLDKQLYYSVRHEVIKEVQGAMGVNPLQK